MEEAVVEHYQLVLITWSYFHFLVDFPRLNQFLGEEVPTIHPNWVEDREVLDCLNQRARL